MPVSPAPRNVAFSVTFFVTPCMLRSPSIWNALSLPGITFVLLNVIVGFFSASKKFGLRRSPSRRSFSVVMLAVCSVTSTLEAETSFAS